MAKISITTNAGTLIEIIGEDTIGTISNVALMAQIENAILNAHRIEKTEEPAP